MTFADQPLFMIRSLGIYEFILCTFILYGLVKAMGAKVRKIIIAEYIFLFVISFLSMLGKESVSRRIYGRKELSSFAKFSLNMPVIAAFLVVAFLTFAAVLLWIRLRKIIRSALTPASLQEGLNRMSDGVCFGTKEGIPLLVNRKMQSISVNAFGEGVLDTGRLRERLINGDVQQGCKTEHRGTNEFLYLSDGSVWDMRETEITLGREKIWEYIAYNITESHEKRRELEIRNAHLEAVNERIREYSRNMDAIIREKEILAAKIQIHDDIGKSLLALRSYLAQNKGNREKLVKLWRFTIDILNRDAVSSNEENPMEALMQAAEAVDVELQFVGELPKDKGTIGVITGAVHECLTNTVKHAGGSRLTVKTEMVGDMAIVEFTNDGRQPGEAVEEKGGLRTLRSTVEMHGGIMEIEVEPCFILRLKLRKEQQEYE